MTTRKQNTSGFLEATGRSWEDWLKFLDGIDAHEMNHTEIASRIAETGLASGWWGQGITVAYEQHIGRRKPGQRASGTFEVSVTRTLAGSMDEALQRWRDLMDHRPSIDSLAWTKPQEVSVKEKWRYWRRPLADGSRVVVTIGRKADGKTLLAVVHKKVADDADVTRWRAIWKAELQEL